MSLIFSTLTKISLLPCITLIVILKPGFILISISLPLIPRSTCNSFAKRAYNCNASEVLIS